ncbi:hypothetical protein PENSPDRAFT_752063 [Peniophora sp. CONT]|nr:hypothetical protein PENSPDRAFT_752063 [Peniophora sp. CONT]
MPSAGSSGRPARAGTKRNYRDDSSSEPEDSPRPSNTPAKPPKKRVKVDKGEGESDAKKSTRSKKPKAPKEPSKKKLWDDRIKKRGEWIQDRKYKHQGHPFTFTKSKALEYAKQFEPKLTERELLTLAYETRPNPIEGYRASHEYSVNDIDALIQEKALALGVTVKAPQPPPPPPPSDDWWDPLHPPLIVPDYTPPENAHPDDPSPEDIIWDGEHIRHRNILLQDACLLYCVNEDDLRDLARHSRWLDRETVAKRAVFLHGGFKRHNEIIVSRRKEAMEAYRAKVAVRNFHDGEPTEHYSLYLEGLFQKRQKVAKESRGLETILKQMWDERCFPGPEHDYSENGYRLRVKQFAPMIQYDERDYGCEWRWYHHWGRCFEGRWDLTA